ncbi:MAG: lipoprotein-releasing ABC transporter permease subunit [Duodenibacillus sp.]|nr:lipoprotein-releasing ABC transporter permease subunit [Duodenibacillus sp.]
MQLPFELRIGWRYTRAGRRGRRKDGFMSFISVISVASIAVGVMALIVVLSVMNGFQKEVRDRMLSVLSHVEAISMNEPVHDWKQQAEALAAADPHILAAAPYVSGQALASVGRTVRGLVLRGIDPEAEREVSDMAATVSPETYKRMEPGKFRIVLGKELARILGVMQGDKVALVLPSGNMTPAGFVPRIKQMTVAGVFRSGHYEYDSSMAMLHVDDAAKLFKTGGPTGIRIRVSDMQLAPAVADRIAAALPSNWYVTDWTQQNRTWFAAVQVEKRMMAIILFLIVLVGAFGLVSALVMTVTEKQADIAILRTLGARPGSIMMIFIVQGAVIGLLGVAIGVGLGLAIACNLDVIVPAVEALLRTQFLPQEIYFISNMPSDPRASDVIPIAVFSFLMALLATLYPSWRAARIHPAEALRYE